MSESIQKTIRIVMAQINLHVGDLKGNADQVIQAVIRARDELKADLVIFPELTLTGYPPEDLLLWSRYGIRFEGLMWYWVTPIRPSTAPLTRQR